MRPRVCLGDRSDLLRTTTTFDLDLTVISRRPGGRAVGVMAYVRHMLRIVESQGLQTQSSFAIVDRKTKSLGLSCLFPMTD